MLQQRVVAGWFCRWDCSGSFVRGAATEDGVGAANSDALKVISDCLVLPLPFTIVERLFCQANDVFAIWGLCCGWLS